MTTSSFPAALDVFVDPTPTTRLADPAARHSTEHTLANDALTAVEARIGVRGTVDTTSVDYGTRLAIALAYIGA